MSNTNFIKKYDELFSLSTQGKDLRNCTPSEINNIVGKIVLDLNDDNWKNTQKLYEQGKQVSYISMEWLLGRAISNNLLALGIYNDVVKYLGEHGFNSNKFDDIPEQNLGNGGLGRLAACFIDAAATHDLPMKGYGLRHRDGFFKQAFDKDMQTELPDTWLENGEEPWSVRREDEKILVKFADELVWAVPYDIPIFGYHTKNINTLRVWQSEPNGEITKNLYPDDTYDDGKILRIKQEYLLVYASIMDMINTCKRYNRDIREFDKYYAVQLNDTHPVMAIPVLYKYLKEQEKLSHEESLEVVRRTFKYTNHTVLSEALEKVNGSLLKAVLPDVFNTIDFLNRKFIEKIASGRDWNTISKYQFILNNVIHMANIAVENSNQINGVAKIHTYILKNETLKQWYELYPERFTNHTNGVTHRRWLLLSNKKLADFITRKIDSNEWIMDFEKISGLMPIVNEPRIIPEFVNIKYNAKLKCVDYIYKHEGIKLNPNALFDIQVKRIHLYKRQLLNLFSIYTYYRQIKENRIDKSQIKPVVSIMGGKAAPGYRLAKLVIKVAKDLQDLINNDPEVNQYLQFVFISNFNTSYGEVLYPAADISEQISTAGKEASGTGNMKFMMNGAVTLGTNDGANIEIFKEAGYENNFLFGAEYKELVSARQNGYNPLELYSNNYDLKRAVDMLNQFNAYELYNSLLYQIGGSSADEFFVLKDFESYMNVKMKAYYEYFNSPDSFAKKQLINIFSSAIFSIDRTIKEYAEDWEIIPSHLK